MGRRRKGRANEEPSLFVGFDVGSSCVHSAAIARDREIVWCSQPVMHYYRGSAQVVRFPLRGDSVQDEGEVVSVLTQHVQPGSSARLVLYSWETVDPQGLVEGQLRALRFQR